MSFSSIVKEEIAKHIAVARHCQLSEFAAIFQNCVEIIYLDTHQIELKLHTDNSLVSTKYFTLLRKAYNINSSNLEKREVENILKSLHYINEEGSIDVNRKTVSALLLKNACCKRAYLRGAFLTIGSISDPKKGYHLEFDCFDQEEAKQIQEILSDFGIEAKIVARKKYYVVYIKEGASIVELLNVIEAHVSLMELENMRIIKEMRNSINRRVNCETANISKTVTASSKQIDDILYLQEKVGFSFLPDQLRKTAEIRLDYPDASLRELGEYFTPPVGKSGINHRLRKLSELASKERNE